MKATGRLILGALTLWPLVYLVVFISSIALTHGGMPFELLFAVHGATMLIYVGLLIYYVAHALRSNEPQNERILWALLLVMGGMITMPIYWYLRVWREATPELPADHVIL